MESGATQARIVRNYQIATEVIGWITLATGFAVVALGWWLGIEVVKRPIPGGVAMHPNTAVGFAAIGLSLVLCARRRWRVLGVASAGVALIIGTVTLAEYVSSSKHTRFDTVLGSEPASVLTEAPGRPAFNTALCMLLLGTALILANLDSSADVRQCLAALVGIIGLAGIFGYILGQGSLASWNAAFTPFAVHTAIELAVVAAAVVMARPDVGWARIISSPLQGGRLFRIGFLPIIAVVLAMSAVAGYLANDFQGGGQPTGVALSHLSYLAMIILLVALLSVASLRDNAIDQKRHELLADLADEQEQLADSERRYRLLAENATDAVFLVDPGGIVDWVSPSIRSVLGFDPQKLVGTNATDLVFTDDLQQLSNVRTSVTDPGTASVFELRMRTVSGEYRWMSGTTGPAIDAHGAVVGRITTVRDVDGEVRARQDLKVTNQALADSERLFRLAMDGAPQGMALVGLDFSFLQTNPAMRTMLGRDRLWFESHGIADVVHPDDVEACIAERLTLLDGATPTVASERRWLRADGTILWVVHSAALLRDEQQRPVYFISHVVNNTDAHQAHEDLRHQASHDPLTGLINRNQLQEQIGTILARKQRRGGPVGLLFCDLDNFKRINDTYGHAAGDEVLRTTAARASLVLRADDVIARLGGDEFVIVLPSVHDAPAAVLVAEKIRAAVAMPQSIGQHEIVVTLSVGVAIAEPSCDANWLLSHADVALYRAKHSGRDLVATNVNGDIRVNGRAVWQGSTPGPGS